MGTHPIFESDFDCLTECWPPLFVALQAASLARSSETHLPRLCPSKPRSPWPMMLSWLPSTPGSSPTTRDELSAELCANGLRGHQGYQQLLRPIPASLPIHFRINEIEKTFIYSFPRNSTNLLVSKLSSILHEK